MSVKRQRRESNSAACVRACVYARHNVARTVVRFTTLDAFCDPDRGDRYLSRSGWPWPWPVMPRSSQKTTCLTWFLFSRNRAFVNPPVSRAAVRVIERALSAAQRGGTTSYGSLSLRCISSPQQVHTSPCDYSMRSLIYSDLWYGTLRIYR